MFFVPPGLALFLLMLVGVTVLFVVGFVGAIWCGVRRERLQRLVRDIEAGPMEQ